MFICKQISNKMLWMCYLQLVLFGEIVLAQKVMYERFGNEFLLNFVSKGFLAAHCPQDLAEQYCQKLQVHSFINIYRFLCK